MTFTEEETEAAVGYSAMDLLEVREWAFTQAIPVMSTTLDQAALVAQDPLPQAPTWVHFEPELVEVRPIVSWWAGETNGRCVPDFLVTGQASLVAPDIDLYFEGTVEMNRVLSVGHSLEGRPVNQTSFHVWLFSESPDLNEVFGYSPSKASAQLYLPPDLSTTESGGLVKAHVYDRDYFYLYW